MKINSIHFKNINSLAGEHQIIFDQPPLSDVGVFAITGPNGSGKTSILDAITLGLYGETHKFERPARHVMTKHAEDCFSEVVFSINKVQYRSSWRVNRSAGTNNDGQMMPEMRLLRISGEEEVLEEKSNKVRAIIAELTGMDFRRFTRSIILAQGDFAAFLDALDSERMDMLEKIISSDVYSDYKKLVYQKADDEKITLEQLKSDIARIPLLEPAKKEAYELDLADFNEQFGELRNEKHTLQEKYSWQQNIGAIKGRLSALKRKEQETTGLLDQKQEVLDKIIANHGMLVYQDDLQEIDNKQQEINDHQKVQAAYQNELTHLDNQLTSLGGAEQTEGESSQGIEALKQSIETLRFQIEQIQLSQKSENELFDALKRQYQDKELVRRESQSWLEEHQADRSLVKKFPDIGKLLDLRVELNTLKEKKTAFLQWKKTTGSLLQKNQAGFEKIKKNIKQLQNKKLVFEHDLEEMLDGRDLEEITGLRADQQDRVVQFRELVNLATEHQTLERKSGGFFSSPGRQSDEHELTDQLAIMTDEFVREQNIKSALDKAVFHEGWLLKHENEREYLEHGQPCPLCGALQHPYAIQPPVASDSKRALIDQTRKVKDLQLNLDKLEKKIRQAQSLTQAEEQKEARMTTLRSRWLTICTKLSAVENKLEIGSIRAMKKKLSIASDELQTIVNLEKQIRGMQQKIVSTDSLIDKQGALLKQLEERNDQLDADWKKRPEELKGLEQDYSRCENEEKNLTSEIDEQLTSLGETMSGTGIEDELIAKLKDRRQQYRIKEQQIVDIDDELVTIQEKAKTSQLELKQIDTRLERCKSQLRKEEIASLLILREEKVSLVAAEIARTEELERVIGLLKEKFLGKISSTDYKTIEPLREILTLLATRPEVEETLLTWKNEIESLFAESEKQQGMLDAELALNITELSVEEIAAQQRSITEKMDITAQEISHFEGILSKEKQLQQQYDKLAEQIKQQQQISDESDNEIKKINENGKAFELSVQEMMVDRLLEKANQFLDKISGRYLVYKKTSEHGLSLEIEDTYQHNIRRLPKTLSGGESFVVSLSLALSLSEQANNGKSVDSLFLDEGFGNLDEESLYMVMSTLKSLKAHGKSVGVISHVKGVMDRIDTRIEMKKTANGISSFEFSY